MARGKRSRRGSRRSRRGSRRSRRQRRRASSKKNSSIDMTTLLLLSQNKSGAYKELTKPAQEFVDDMCKRLKPAAIKDFANSLPDQVTSRINLSPNLEGLETQGLLGQVGTIKKALLEKCGSSMNPLLMAQLLGGGKKLDATTLMLMGQNGGSGDGLSPAAIFALTSGSSKIDATTLMLMNKDGMDEQTRKFLLYQMLSKGGKLSTTDALLMGGINPQAAAGMSPDILNMQGMLEKSVMDYSSDEE